MLDGSPRPPPLPTSAFNFNHTAAAAHDDHDHDLTSSSMSPRTFPLSARSLNAAAAPPPNGNGNGNMKGKMFGSAPASPTTARPKSGYQSVRGRISGPIPIQNARAIEDDEFPMRNPGTGIASSTPIENDLIVQRQLSLPATMSQGSHSPATPSFPTQPPPMPTVAQTFPANGRAEILDVPQTVPEHPSTPTRPPGSATRSQGGSGPSPDGPGARSSVSGVRNSARLHRTNPSASARYSTISGGDSSKTGSTGEASPPQRKKSTLRSAVGRLFKRKKKEGSLSSVSESERQSALAGAAQQPQHRSVPPAIRTQPDPDLQQQKRVASMPISEFDRALRSHSIGPDDITAIESARNSIDALGSAQFSRRAAAAVNGTIYTGFPPRSRGEDWAGLSPRPASTHGRAGRSSDETDAIGRAITSDVNDVAHKRRSRSLSQLDEVLLPGEGRRRSDEIRYWRQSFVPTSPLSSGPDEDKGEIVDTLDATRRPSITAVESSADRMPRTPPQPFNFGTVASMSEMAGMKITQAVTLEERFSYLEVRMNKLERVVTQLCHSVPGFKGPFVEVPTPVRAPSNATAGRGRSGSASVAATGVPTHNVTVSQPAYAYSNIRPPMIPSIYQADPSDPKASPRYTNSRQSVETDDNASSRMSFGEGNTYMDSLHPPSSSATQAVSTVATSVPPMPGRLRPTSDATVRGANSMPSLGSQSTGGEDRSSNTAILIAQLDSERAARQLLEDQVRKLSERMNNLSTTMFAMVRDPARSKSSERLRPQTAGSATPNGNSTPHLAPISGNATGRAALSASSKAQSIFGKESAGLGIGDIPASPAKDAAEDDYSDAFQTPREGLTPGVGTAYSGFGDEFGAGSQEAEEEEKRAARVLSLSQLTMGTGLPTRI